MRTHCLAAGALAALLTNAACIERPPSPRDGRIQFDRGRLSDLLLHEVPGSAKRVGAVFGEAVELAAVEFSPARPKPGDAVAVDYYFRVLEESEEDFKVFVHIDDRGGQAERINGDHWPAAGRYPVKVWRKGEIVKDRWSFRVPSYYNGEGFELWTGFYQPGKDDRWPLANRSEVRNDGQNRVLAASVPMR